jgi:hypothetical protein
MPCFDPAGGKAASGSTHTEFGNLLSSGGSPRVQEDVHRSAMVFTRRISSRDLGAAVACYLKTELVWKQGP